MNEASAVLRLSSWARIVAPSRLIVLPHRINVVSVVSVLSTSAKAFASGSPIVWLYMLNAPRVWEQCMAIPLYCILQSDIGEQLLCLLLFRWICPSAVLFDDLATKRARFRCKFLSMYRHSDETSVIFQKSLLKLYGKSSACTRQRFHHVVRLSGTWAPCAPRWTQLTTTKRSMLSTVHTQKVP